MTKHLLLLCFLLTALTVKAQYPFEKVKAIKYQMHKDWHTTLSAKDSMPVKREITLTAITPKKANLKIVQELKISLPDSLDYADISIYKNNQLIKTFGVSTGTISDPLPVYVADINGDGLKDIKIIFPNYGCGAYNFYCQVVYLFQNKNGSFTDLSYSDIFEDFVNKPERDFNNDGKYEIMTQTFQSYAKHNYWLFNLYNYQNGKLVNVNGLANYPIMIPLNSYNVSKKISKQQLKKFEIKNPVK